MCRFVILIITVFAFGSSRAQNQELELLLKKYRSNPAIEHVNMSDSIPDDKDVKVAETLDFGDSLYLVRHFVEEFHKIKGSKKLKATKVLNVNGSLLMKMMLNKAVAIRQWTGKDGYKDTVIEFDGCIYAIIHLGGFYKDDEIGKFIIVNSVPHQKHKHRASDAACSSLTDCY